ncbi:hypothetical protein C5B96_00705 [Subtercola sp. Z020]|nr:hypothetical protein C5B96_00705 [Subtercola sp. Z020]
MRYAHIRGRQYDSEATPDARLERRRCDVRRRRATRRALPARGQKPAPGARGAARRLPRGVPPVDALCGDRPVTTAPRGASARRSRPARRHARAARVARPARGGRTRILTCPCPCTCTCTCTCTGIGSGTGILGSDTYIGIGIGIYTGTGTGTGGTGSATADGLAPAQPGASSAAITSSTGTEVIVVSSTMSRASTTPTS